ncbi:fatty acyl-AMP ligase [Sandarakinorhabdus limnophila]|uniref:fatty acyl-AMP ligase n=1 Tax=Sandarakinorhabdus limnophila TaxID=210512 RepID=UPI0026F07D1B|nr:fatty acyl-AMP ligase [Sandarakinorhabdus limnophila]MCM0031418.1 fatty acyl-AMP ligase [Sandarakinorhabdus limnophila]
MADTPQAASASTLKPTATSDALPQRRSNFATLGDALDYAAQGQKGFNFHDARADLVRAYPFSELAADARRHAAHFIAEGVQPGDRIALIAETGAGFAAAFFGAIYAGALPVPLPLPTSFGGREAYVDQIRVQLTSCDPLMLLSPPGLHDIVKDAATGLCAAHDWDECFSGEAPDVTLPKAKPTDIAYLQYSSGSTRFPHGVAVTHEALLANLSAHATCTHAAEGDRVVSWLPWYHDMGLVGCMLAPMSNQVSVDYLATEDFARRPLSWLTLISRNPDASLSYSPTFGYDICARRISPSIPVAERYDLSRWRVAGNGADMIRPEVMQAFVDTFAPAGFKASAFLPSYGLAEATLAVTIMPVGEGIQCDLIDERTLSGATEPRADHRLPTRYRAIVNCGKAVPGLTIEVRDENGRILPDRKIGRVFVKGLGIMAGYFRDPEATAACMKDGWLDTGDMAYMKDGSLYIVGRAKDMIIINGKNHWPQDIEWAIEQLPGFKAGDIAAFSVTTPSGEEAPAVLVQCRTSCNDERIKLRDAIKTKVKAITGMSCVVELVPPRTLPRTSSGKLSRSKARLQYLSGEIQPFEIAA